MPKVKNKMTGEIVANQPYTAQGTEMAEKIAQADSNLEIDYAPGGTNDARMMREQIYAGGGKTGYNKIGAQMPSYKEGGKVDRKARRKARKEARKEFRERKAETKASGKNKVVARQSDNPRHWKDERADQSDTSRTDKNVWSMQGKGGELSSKAKTMDEGYEKQKTLLKAKVKSSNRQPTKKELRELKRLARKEKRAKIKATRK